MPILFWLNTVMLNGQPTAGAIQTEHILIDGVHVHGGLTYAGTEDDGIHWFGFDCAHAGDLSPGILIHLLETRMGEYNYLRGEEYRTWDYVKTEIERMAVGIYIAAEAMMNKETLAAFKEAARSGASVTDELAKRGYVRFIKKRG